MNVGLNVPLPECTRTECTIFGSNVPYNYRIYKELVLTFIYIVFSSNKVKTWCKYVLMINKCACIEILMNFI